MAGTAMDKAEVIRRVTQYAAVLAQELPVTQVILFGSYVAGRQHEDSDIDVAVVMHDVATDDYLAVLKRLCRLRTPIDPMIEPHLLLEVGNNGGFLQEVERTGEVIYRAA
jgi:predicted nucleotidyltransferase